jgi:histidinol-phosphatase (PHP family)
VIVDYHMHLRAPDESLDFSVAAVERFVESAAAHGVDEIGFSEHVYYFRQTAELWDVPYQSERCRHDLDDYCEAVVEAKGQGMPVKLGLEVDWVPAQVELVAELLAPYPWDYLLGSIHYLDGLALDSEPSLVGELGPDAAWERYFAELGDLARSGLVDVLAHPDLVKFFGHLVEWDPGAFAGSLDEAGVALEISTAGRYKPHGRIYPEADLLAAGRAAGLGITLASDAHLPENVGRDFELAVEHARAAGYDSVTVFDARRARTEPLG